MMRSTPLLILLILASLRALDAAEHDAPAVRARLLAGIDAIAAVRAAVDPPGTLRADQRQRIAEALPWRRTLLPIAFRFGEGRLPLAAAWPVDADAAALRTLLADSVGPIRGYAAEALATLHQPEDAARLMAMLADREVAQDEISAVAFGHQGAVLAGPRDGGWAWVPSRVANHAAKGLHILLGDRCPDIVDPHGGPTGFGPSQSWSAETGDDPALWPALLGGDPLDQLWYWQGVASCAMDGAILTASAADVGAPAHARLASEQLSDLEAASYQRWEQAWLRDFAAQQLAWPAERRAMVRLLARRPGHAEAFFPAPLDLGLPKARVLDLLAGRNLWPGTAGEEAYLVQRLAGAWRECFTAADAPLLRARFADQDLHWWARAELLHALAGLLPPGSADADDATTASGFLRRVLGYDQDAILHPAAAGELIRLDLEGHWAVLLAAFLREDATFQEAVLEALGAEPTGGTASARLADLLGDPRVRHILLEIPVGGGKGKGGGPDAYLRSVALRAVMMRCGARLPPAELDGIDDPARVADVVGVLLGRLREHRD